MFNKGRLMLVNRLMRKLAISGPVFLLYWDHAWVQVITNRIRCEMQIKQINGVRIVDGC
jgi:hypothetical protein